MANLVKTNPVFIVKLFFGLFFFLLAVTVSIGQTYTVETVPNNKLINNSYVSNPDRLLSDDAVRQINLLLDSLEKKTTAQVAVVMLKSIGDADIFEFAQSLFVKWGIGKGSTDNGLLILFVEDQRTVRFHTGYGLEGILTDALCKRIQTQFMVPHFKESNIDSGMIAGVQQVVKIISDPNSNEVTALKAESADDIPFSGFVAFCWAIIGLGVQFVKRGDFADSKGFISRGPIITLTKKQWLFWYYGLPIVLLLGIAFLDNALFTLASIYGYPMALALNKYNRVSRVGKEWMNKGEYHTAYEFFQDYKGHIARAILFPLPFLFLNSKFKKLKLSARQYPRPCKKCKKPIEKPLTESQEDEYLTAEAIFEEKLKSVDYDVWRCSSCGDFSYEMYIHPKTKFSECPQCNTYALYSESSHTKIVATTLSTGILEVIKRCKYCKKTTPFEETIPIISTASISDSSSSSSSSSDSGGSWGGGDSGGGGASSSW